MKKEILSTLGVLFIVAILISGCGKPEEKEAEAPSVKKQSIQQEVMSIKEKAIAVPQEMVEKAEATVKSAAEKAATMTEQAVDAAKEKVEKTEAAVESATEKKAATMTEQAVDAAKEMSQQAMDPTKQ